MAGGRDVETCCAHRRLARCARISSIGRTYAWQRHYGRERRPWVEEVVDSEGWAQLAEKWYARVPLGRVNRHKSWARHCARETSDWTPYHRRPVHAHALLLPQSPLFPRPSMSSDVVLPGQPIPLPRGPIPQIGSGIYSRDGVVRASLIGVPSYSGSVGLFALFLPA